MREGGGKGSVGVQVIKAEVVALLEESCTDPCLKLDIPGINECQWALLTGTLIEKQLLMPGLPHSKTHHYFSK